MDKLDKDQFRCGECGQVFVKGWTDEECLEEMKETFGNIPEEQRAYVCDECYKKLMKEH